MSRAPIVLSAAAIFCASFLALADEKGVIASATENGAPAVIQKSKAKPREHGDRFYRHYRGNDEAPSATTASRLTSFRPPA